jgi:TonB-linked SusC/RagA family outer membrane protein
MRLFLPPSKSSLRLVLLIYCGFLVPLKLSAAKVQQGSAAADEFAITGKITDQTGDALPGVNVRNLATKTGTATNNQGGYIIKASQGDTIMYSMMGYEVVKIVASPTKHTINLSLKASVQELKTVAVTALGIKREERELGYSYSEVSGSEIDKAREPNVINSLAGKVPGLVITSTAGGPAGASRVIIRGNTSVTGDNQPLYVIDGIPMDNSNYGSTGGGKFADGFDLGDAISAINPDDIDKISVLKGPSASALYGSSAANGVILITTKKGKNKKELGIDFNSTTSFESQLTKYDDYQYIYGQGRGGLLPTDQQQSLGTLFVNFGPRLDPGLTYIGFDGQPRTYGLVKNNIDGFFRTGVSTTNTISLSTNTETTNFRISASNIKINDVVPNSGLQRNTFNFSGFSKFGKRLTLDTRVFYLNENVKNRPALADNASNIGNSLIGLANNIDQAYFKDHYKDENGNYLNWQNDYRLNPYWVVNEMTNESKKDRITGSFQLNYKINNWLDVQGRTSTDFTYFSFEKFSPRSTPLLQTGVLDAVNAKYLTNQSDVLITGTRAVSKDVTLTTRLGGSIYSSRRYGTTNQYINQVIDDKISPNSYATKTVIENDVRKQKRSVYGLLTAAFRHYLYLDATIRTDASSTLPSDNNTYTYTSLSGSFVFSDAFKITNSFLSFGKIRASIAEVGNDTDPYALNLYYNLAPTTFQGVSLGTISSTTLPNANLKPTRTRSFEVGTNLKFFNDRITFDATYYTQKSRDQINVVPAPGSSGFTRQVVNAGTIANKGIELALGGSPIIAKDFSWDLNLNFARNINEVLSLADGNPFISLADARWLGLSVVAMPGAPYGAILGYNYQYDPNGNVILDPVTLLPAISASREVLGKGTFSWTGGIGTKINYKNFSIGTVLDIKSGADLFSMTNYQAAYSGNSTMTLPGRDEWIQSEEARLAAGQTAAQWAAAGNVKGYVPQGVIKTTVNGQVTYTPNTTAIDPSVYWGRWANSNSAVPSKFLYDATYVKVREITVTYRFPAKLISRIGLKNLAISGVSRNPFILYKNVPNVDPDSNYQNGNGQGLEYGSLPSRKSFGFNINMKF